MTILDTALAIVAFVGFFALVEYGTYRLIEREHKKRQIYRLFLMLGWTTLAFVHMWVVAPLLNLPPTAVVALGLGILVLFILGLSDLPILGPISIIGLYPFAQVYELFFILLVLAEGVTWVASLVTIPQLYFLGEVAPSDPYIQAAFGLGAAASFVALTFYSPEDETGYYYVAGKNLPAPEIDSEGIQKMIEEAEADTERPTDQEVTSSAQTSSHGDSYQPGATRARAKVPDDPDYEYNWTRSDARFTDIGGYYDIKDRLSEEALQPVRATAQGDDRYDRFGIEPSRGILLYGPPGTGKTLFARALAGELDVPFVELGPADVTSKWINEGPQRIRQLFEEAASIGLCVIFLDEAEHLFGGRDVGTGGAHAEDRKITSELLVHLTADDRTAIVVGATNRPGDIDPAILRPGRLATHLEIGLPDEESRHAIFQAKLEGVPHALTGGELATLAELTEGFTGAEIQNLVDTAKRSAATRDAGELSMSDFPSAEGLARMTAARARDRGELPNPDQEDGGDDHWDGPVGYQ